MIWPRLTLVIGKGGSGKSTVAAAIAMALARRRPTLLVGLDRRGSAARLLETMPDGAEAIPAGANLSLCMLDSRRELERFIKRIVPVAAISRRLLSSRTFSYVSAAVPGLDAFVVLSRLSSLGWEAAREDRYVVVDGLSSGSSLELLSVATAMRKLASTGTLNRLAIDLEGFIADPARFGVAVVMKPQGLALSEGLAAAGDLRERLGIKAITSILNAVPSALFQCADFHAARLPEPEERMVRKRFELEAAARHSREALRAAGLEGFELPMLFTASFGRDQVSELARTFASEDIS